MSDNIDTCSTVAYVGTGSTHGNKSFCEGRLEGRLFLLPVDLGGRDDRGDQITSVNLLTILVPNMAPLEFGALPPLQ